MSIQILISMSGGLLGAGFASLILLLPAND